MSQENVEIVKAAFEAWNTGDWDAIPELFDPNVVVRPSDDWPEAGPFVGTEAVTRWFRQLREAWDADSTEPISDFIDVADHVVVRFLWRTTGLGPESNMEISIAYTLRKGKISAMQYFWDHADALKAVGLSEQDAQADTSS
jgi:ketosteroid isomerase-like protein